MPSFAFRTLVALIAMAYAVCPRRIIQWKYGDEEVPQLSIKIARWTGIAVVILYCVWLVISLFS